MRVFGYEEQDSEELLTLREVTFEITAAQAKRLGDFFLKCASEMNRPDWEHEHFNDGVSPDVIVYSKQA